MRPRSMSRKYGLLTRNYKKKFKRNTRLEIGL